ncbi:MAG: SEL1-like repeat protein [Steroidobacteraceae bacterium]
MWSASAWVQSAASQSSPDAATIELQAVTIRGTRAGRELARQVNHFVTSEVFQLSGESLIRWDTPICPLVQGLPAAFNEYLESRITQVALAARAPVAGRHCKENLYVFVSSHPEQLLNKLWKKNPGMYGAPNGLGGPEGFIHSRRPVRVWYNTESNCQSASGDSAGIVSMGMNSGMAQPAGRPLDMSAGMCSNVDTRLNYAAINALSSAFIVVDMSQMREITTGQLADYVAMVGLAQVRTNTDLGKASTILGLFDDPTHPPQGLSPWDHALLYSLYNTNQKSIGQISEIEDTVLTRVAHQADSADQPAVPAWVDEVLPQRDAKITYWYLVGAEQGNAAAEYDLGVAEAQGEGEPKDDAKAAQWFLKAAQQGNVRAQYNLGAMYDLGDGVPQDYAQAAVWFRKAAEQGNANAQSNLGAAYANGQGVPQDYAQAAQWYQKAAEQGYIDAQVNLASMYVDGNGVPRDYAKAAHWYSTAAQQGNAAAQYDLGVTYLEQGGPQNYADAAQWFRKAAEQGDVHAQRSLGLAYAKGQGLPRDFAQAAQWFRKAAEQGDANAQYYLGNMFNSGLGVRRDSVAAYKWWTLARSDSSVTDDAHGRSMHKLRVSASHLSAEQIARADREASEWLADHHSAR